MPQDGAAVSLRANWKGQRERDARSLAAIALPAPCAAVKESDNGDSVGVDGPRRHQACQNEVAVNLRQRRPSVDQISRIGMDTSKHVFQLHGVNAAEEPVLRKKLRRKEMFAFLEKLAPTVIAIEACGASHHCARLLQSFGHSVKLIAPPLAKPYIKRGKNDAADPCVELARSCPCRSRWSPPRPPFQRGVCFVSVVEHCYAEDFVHYLKLCTGRRVVEQDRCKFECKSSAPQHTPAKEMHHHRNGKSWPSRTERDRSSD